MKKLFSSKLPVVSDADKQALTEKAQTFTDRYTTKMDSATVYLDRISAFISPVTQTDVPPTQPERYAAGPITFGMWTIIIVFGFLGVWSALAPLDSAAVARATVVVDSNKKTIQHLEGGIIDEILVKEGDIVKKNDPLIRLNQTAAKARVGILRSQYFIAKSAASRLLAERDGKQELEFPEELTKAQNDSEYGKEATEAMDTQRRMFISRRDTLTSQVNILEQRIKQSQEEIEGLQAQEKSARQQMSLLDEEISTVQKLLAAGNAMKPRLLALQRSRSDLDGKRGEYVALIARARQTIGQAEIEKIGKKNDFTNNINTELRDTQAQLADLEEKLRASDDILERIVIVAPQDGKVNDLQYHTVGGVIPPGGKVMDIVPLQDKMVFDAQVSPQDIHIVHEGLHARVRLTAYKTRRVPIVEGHITNVSADKFTDQRTGMTYYNARVELDPKQLEHLAERVQLYPGMPAEALIVTGRRTVLSYLISPLTDSMRRAFREE